MPPLCRRPLVSVLVLSAWMAAVAAETVEGVAGRRVRLPCRVEAAGRGGAEVCWGRGQPPVFSCQNAVIHAAGSRVMYRKSYRYSVSSLSSSLSIYGARPADSGLYHCRVQLPGLFNDQTATVYLTVMDVATAGPRSPKGRYQLSPASGGSNAETLNAPRSTVQDDGRRGGDNATGPAVARVQSSVQRQGGSSLPGFVGNTVRASFIIFIPALLLAAAYRYCGTSKRAKTDGLDQPEEEVETTV